MNFGHPMRPTRVARIVAHFTFWGERTIRMGGTLKIMKKSEVGLERWTPGYDIACSSSVVCELRMLLAWALPSSNGYVDSRGQSEALRFRLNGVHWRSLGII